MKHVFETISKRLLRDFSIDIKKYMYLHTLTEGPTTLDGIKFVAHNEVIGSAKPVAGIDDLKNAFARARKDGKRAFAGQILKEDLNHGLLQASFGNTKGLGFREIFYLSQHPAPVRDPGAGNVLDSDGRAFDAKFGEMADVQDVTSLHASLVGPHDASPPISSIHLDDKGFVFADSDGRIFLSSEVIQHLGDEFLIKDKLLGGASPLSFFFHTDLNSIAGPTLGSVGMRNNNFLRKQVPRGVLGLELSKESNGLQFYLRGSLGIEAPGLQRPKLSDVSGVAGVRGRF